MVIIEGCGVIHPEVSQYYDITAWINCTQKKALKMAKMRDSSEKNLFKCEDTDKLWDEVWGPNDRDYFAKFRPDLQADIILNNGFNTVQ
jgi:hypothetical protein